MIEVHPRGPRGSLAHKRLTRCAACTLPCTREEDELVGFCDECLEASDPRTYQGYPEGWVTLGGGD